MLTLPPDAEIRLVFPLGGLELQNPKKHFGIGEFVEPGETRAISATLGLKIPFPSSPYLSREEKDIPSITCQTGTSLVL